METQPGKERTSSVWLVYNDKHVHMIIGTAGKELDAIVGEMKSYTSTELKKL